MAGSRQGEENVTFSPTCKNLMCSLVSWCNFSDHVCDKGEGLEPHQYTVDIQRWCFQSLTATTHAPALPTHRGATWKVKKRRQHKNQSQLDMKGWIV